MNKRKTVIVTGASSGIGLAIAKAYLANGDNVIGNARSLTRLNAAFAPLGREIAEQFLPIAGDIADPQTAETLFASANAQFGGADVLINNAGLFIAKPITAYTVEEVDLMVNTLMKGFFYPAQQAAQHLRDNGHIVAITAALAMQPNSEIPALLSVLLKGGINQAVKALALELAPRKICVNAVAPGIIATPMHQDASLFSQLAAMAPLNQTGDPQDIVNAVLYLTASQFVTGTILPVDGGSTAGVWPLGH